MERAEEEGNATGGTQGDGTPLEVLRWNWGEAYEIGCDDGEWWYRRRDGLGGRQTAQNADALHKLVIEDYTFLPVRRETP
jgi:hypothetical protein